MPLDMRCVTLFAGIGLGSAGCLAPYPTAWSPPTATALANPLHVPSSPPDHLWQQLVDVVDDRFPIAREQRVQAVGNVLTEGRIETLPQGGATILEPHRNDSVGRFNRWESTLQTIRRIAHVRVIPTPQGYWVELIVEKQLEELPQPEHATSGAATFRNDSAPRGNPIREELGEGMSRSWIPQGRDILLEQEMLREIQSRLGG